MLNTSDTIKLTLNFLDTLCQATSQAHTFPYTFLMFPPMSKNILVSSFFTSKAPQIKYESHHFVQ